MLGGITVLTHLNPATVAAHFLVSMGLVWRVDVPAVAGRRAGRADAVRSCGPSWSGSPARSPLLTAVVLLLGTLVTGSGPHSGDADAPARFGLDPRAMSWLHSDAVLRLVRRARAC